MRGNVKAITILCALLVLPLSTAGLSASAAEAPQTVEAMQTMNDYDPSLWDLGSGATAEKISDGEKCTGVEFLAAGDFTAKTSDLDPMEFMVDFSVFPKEGENPTVSVALSSEAGEFADIDVKVGANSYSAELKVGEKSVVLSNVAYGFSEIGKQIELRLAYDNLLDLETQVYSENWNFVAGCDKWSNVQRNIYIGNAEEKAAMGEIGAELSSRLGEKLDFSISLKGFSESKLYLTQLNTSYYYDYALFAAPTVKDAEDVYYNRIAFSFRGIKASGPLRHRQEFQFGSTPSRLFPVE